MSQSKSKSESKGKPADESGVEAHSLYRNFLDVREEVLRHKWLKSEEAGEDIGFESALLDLMASKQAAAATKTEA